MGRETEIDGVFDFYSVADECDLRPHSHNFHSAFNNLNRQDRNDKTKPHQRLSWSSDYLESPDFAPALQTALESHKLFWQSRDEIHHFFDITDLSRIPTRRKHKLISHKSPETSSPLENACLLIANQIPDEFLDKERSRLCEIVKLGLAENLELKNGRKLDNLVDSMFPESEKARIGEKYILVVTSKYY